MTSIGDVSAALAVDDYLAAPVERAEFLLWLIALSTTQELYEQWRELRATPTLAVCHEVARSFYPTFDVPPMPKSEAVLRDAVRLCNSLVSSDLVGECRALLNAVSGENRGSGDYQTPMVLGKFMAAIAAPQQSESCYDPSCGYGGLLLDCADHLRQHNPNAIPQLTGMDKSSPAVRRARLLLTIGGYYEEAHIVQGNTLDTLAEPASLFSFLSPRYDVIVANPPFGGKESPDVQKNFPVPTSATELLFLQHIIASLTASPTARFVCIVPLGVLFNSSKAHQAVRQRLVCDGHLQAIIGLPTGAFAPHTNVKCAVLVWQKEAHNPLAEGQTLCLDIEVDGLGNKRPLTQADLAGALAMWATWKAYLDTPGASALPFPLSHKVDSPTSVWVESAYEWAKRDYDLKLVNPSPVTTTVQYDSPDKIMDELERHIAGMDAGIKRIRAMLRGDW
jgi:type I restriction-modification system DNA methylase subunit